MKHHGMIFNHEMVRAILDGRKTQTRRMVKPQRHPFGNMMPADEVACEYLAGTCVVKVPIRVGSIIWVRETFAAPWGKLHEKFYRADDPKVYKSDGRWTPSIHMPRWASRIDLEVTAVRVERLQDISEEDAKSEGVFRRLDGPDIEFAASPDGTMHWSAKDAFRDLWQSIYSNWKDNPFVWVYEFRRLK